MILAVITTVPDLFVSESTYFHHMTSVFYQITGRWLILPPAENRLV
jgi:hypothetical protein